MLWIFSCGVGGLTFGRESVILLGRPTLRLKACVQSCLSDRAGSREGLMSFSAIFLFKRFTTEEKGARGKKDGFEGKCFSYSPPSF